MTSPVIDAVKRFFVQRFWPYFIEHVWPIIRKEVIAVVVTVFSFLRGQVEDYLNRRGERQQEEVEQKAEEADRQAAAAMNETESARWRGRAEAYREQAETLRSENERLRRELDQIISKASNSAKSNVDNIGLKVEGSDRLNVGESSVPLLGPTEADIDVDTASGSA